MWNITLLTLFPEMFPGPLGHSITGNAIRNNICNINIKNLRDYGLGKHKNVDDYPYGGGPGMLIKPEVISSAIEDIKHKSIIEEIIFVTPRGKVFNQQIASDLITKNNILFICGRYEGIDQRVIEKYKIKEISIGDFILSGGEIAIFTILDSCIRLLPNVLGSNESTEEESFSGEYQYLLEYPQYTNPRIWNDMKVPEVLLSGHHKNIEKWRKNQAKIETQKKRPDLWQRYLTTHKK